MGCLLGVDIGTTSTVGILIRPPDQVLATASRVCVLHAPQPGWAEADPGQWWDNVCAITRELMRSAQVGACDIAAIGVAGMLPAVVLLDAQDRLLRPSIQQGDGRCGEQVAALRREACEADFLARTGNGINQQLVGAKLRWLEHHEPEVFARIATVFGSYDYINWRLTGLRAVEQNWAMESGFADLATNAIDDGLVALAHVPRGVVPRLVASHAILGHVDAPAAAQTGLAAGTPVVGGAADMIASALAAGLVRPGDVLLKFGGAVDILAVSQTARPDRRLFLDRHLIPGLFVPNGCMSTGGSVLNWFVATLAAGEAARAAAAGVSVHRWLDGLAAARPAGADGVAVLPYLLGEKTPLHDPAARGLIDGLTLSHDLGHLWRAVLESYAYAIAHHVEVLQQAGHATARFVASDGGAASDVWLQIVADVLGEPVQRLSGHPGSCLGAAWTAGMGVGAVDDWGGISRFVGLGTRFQPKLAHAATYADGYRRFRALQARQARGQV